MQALSHSPFLQALGYAIANSLWQIALLWLVVILLNGLVKTSSANRYRMALTAQFSGFAWFLLTFRFYYIRCTDAISDLQQLQLNNTSSFFIESAGSRLQGPWLQWLIKAEQFLPWLSVAYLVLLVFLAVNWTRSYAKAAQIRQTGLEKISIDWRLFVQKAAWQLNIKSKVHIYLSSVVNSPLTVGFLKPVILIPLASINHLTTEQMEAVILHELAHIKRADYLINLIQTVIEIVLFFNPFTRLLSTQIRKERENCCDDWVLQFQYNPAMYAQALLNIARLQPQPAFTMPATGVKGDLLPRVKRMLNKQENETDYKRHLSALLLMTGVFIIAALCNPAGTNNTGKLLPQPPVGNNTESIAVEPITTTVSNPLFSPVFFLSRNNSKVTGTQHIHKVASSVSNAVLLKSEKPATTSAATQTFTFTQVSNTSASVTLTQHIHFTSIEKSDKPGPGRRMSRHGEGPFSGGFNRDHMPDGPVTAFFYDGPNHGRMPGEQDHGPAAGTPPHEIQMLSIFADVIPPVHIRVHPPLLASATETDPGPRFFRANIVFSAPPPQPAAKHMPSPALVLERMLQGGTDSVNQILLSSLAHAGNSADSIQVLRRFYKEVWQQQRQRRVIVQHWAYAQAVYVENGNTQTTTVQVSNYSDSAIHHPAPSDSTLKMYNGERKNNHHNNRASFWYKSNDALILSPDSAKRDLAMKSREESNAGTADNNQ